MSYYELLTIEVWILIFANIQTNRWSCGGQTGAMNIDHLNFSLLQPIPEPGYYKDKGNSETKKSITLCVHYLKTHYINVRCLTI